ncbi:hypothetical protein BGX33_003399, partial [Mortierella sp. NVP41]
MVEIIRQNFPQSAPLSAPTADDIAGTALIDSKADSSQNRPLESPLGTFPDAPPQCTVREQSTIEATFDGSVAQVTLRDAGGNAGGGFLTSTEQGDAQAQYDKGEQYFHGRGVPVDYATAMTCFLQAAEQGLPSAQLSIGFLYEQGLGVSQDYKAAMD